MIEDKKLFFNQFFLYTDTEYSLKKFLQCFFLYQSLGMGEKRTVNFFSSNQTPLPLTK